MKLTTRRKVGILIVIAITVVFMILEGFIDFRTKLKNADETSTLLLAEAIQIVSNKADEQNVLVDSLKEDYITRARAISYTVEHDSELEENVAELNKIATLMGVDEIHLFDTNGVIYGGTVEEYYGVGMDDGEQIGYFKPMLQNQGLAMCQDVSPNTAEGKFMMYALVWREDRKGMVQVGIEPHRLFSEMHSNQIVEIVDSMPMAEGYSIYVADKVDGIIYGASLHEAIGRSLAEIGIKQAEDKLGSSKTEVINGAHYRVVFEECNDYLIGVAFKYGALNEDIMYNLLIVAVCIIGFMLFILWLVTRFDKRRDFFQEEIDKSNEDRDRQYRILKSMSEMYTSMYLVDLTKNTVSEYVATDKIREQFIETDDIPTLVRTVMTARLSMESREDILKFCDIHTIPQRMQNVKSIYRDFVNIEGKWCRATFIAIDVDEIGSPITFVYAVMDIDEEKRREEMLLLKSNTDELTRCLNRRAYEDDIREYESKGTPDKLILVSMDINGLKATNDSKGHAAGDELILGAVACMKQAMSNYGRIYRTGGDEFMAILLVTPQQMLDIEKEFNELTAKWTGKLVKNVAVSMGYVIYKEDKPEDFAQMERLADERMYASKSQYYSKRGVDRRYMSANS